MATSFNTEKFRRLQTRVAGLHRRSSELNAELRELREIRGGLLERLHRANESTTYFRSRDNQPALDPAMPDTWPGLLAEGNHAAVNLGRDNITDLQNVLADFDRLSAEQREVAAELEQVGPLLRRCLDFLQERGIDAEGGGTIGAVGADTPASKALAEAMKSSPKSNAYGAAARGMRR